MDATESELDEAEYLLEGSGRRNGGEPGELVDDNVAITVESASVCYPDDANRFLLLSRLKM